MRSFVVLIALLVSLPSVSAAKFSIIIDDMGNHAGDAAAFRLPNAVTFAILPHKPLSRVYAERAAAQQREVILHMPMESLARAKQEEDLLISDMQPQEIRLTLNKALKTVPHAVGVNNHMGSRFTQLSLPMSITMEYLAEKGLFFIDSRTTRYSRATLMAKKRGVRHAERNVFLDHNVSEIAIDMQFKRLLDLAKKNGYALGIAHPHEQTLDYLERELTKLDTQTIQLVPLASVL